MKSLMQFFKVAKTHQLEQMETLRPQKISSWGCNPQVRTTALGLATSLKATTLSSDSGVQRKGTTGKENYYLLSQFGLSSSSVSVLV